MKVPLPYKMNGETTLEFQLWTDEWKEMIANSKFPDFNPDFARCGQDRLHRASGPWPCGLVQEPEDPGNEIEQLPNLFKCKEAYSTTGGAGLSILALSWL